MTIKTRLAKLETKKTPGVKKYLCCCYFPSETGYKIQPCIKSKGGTGGEPFHLDTWEEVLAFGERADVDLDIVKICYQGKNEI